MRGLIILANLLLRLVRFCLFITAIALIIHGEYFWFFVVVALTLLVHVLVRITADHRRQYEGFGYDGGSIFDFGGDGDGGGGE